MSTDTDKVTMNINFIIINGSIIDFLGHLSNGVAGGNTALNIHDERGRSGAERSQRIV